MGRHGSRLKMKGSKNHSIQFCSYQQGNLCHLYHNELIWSSVLPGFALRYQTQTFLEPQGRKVLVFQIKSKNLRLQYIIF